MQPWCGYVIRQLNHDNCKIVRSLKRKRNKKKNKEKRFTPACHFKTRFLWRASNAGQLRTRAISTFYHDAREYSSDNKKKKKKKEKYQSFPPFPFLCDTNWAILFPRRTGKAKVTEKKGRVECRKRMKTTIATKIESEKRENTTRLNTDPVDSRYRSISI